MATQSNVLAAVYTNDFNSLSTGSLTGQDGWVRIYDPVFGPGNYGTAGDVFTVSPGNNAVRASSPENNSYGSKIVPGGFTFNSSLIDAYIQADIRKSNSGQIMFAIGPDVDGDGAVEDAYGGGGNERGATIHLTPTVMRWLTARGTGSDSNVYGPNDDNGDWLQIRLLLNFAANGGSGAGSLYYRNITDNPGAGFTQLTTPINLNILSQFTGASANPANWKGFATALEGTGWALDNIEVDIPEPTSAVLLALGSMILFARRVCR